jgi:hypothetical protein
MQVIPPSTRYTKAVQNWQQTSLPAMKQSETTAIAFVLVGTDNQQVALQPADWAATAKATVTTMPFVATLSGFQARQAVLSRDYSSSCFAASDSDSSVVHATYSCHAPATTTTSGPFPINGGSDDSLPSCERLGSPSAADYWGQQTPQDIQVCGDEQQLAPFLDTQLP